MRDDRTCSRTRAALLVAVMIMIAPGYAGAQGRGRGQGDAASPAGPTPRTADGKPDLSGYWGRLMGDNAGPIDTGGQGGGGNLDGTQETFAKYWSRAEKDIQENRRGVVNKPIYKPEYWAKIREIDWDNSRMKDPDTLCMPSVPRLGIPQKVLQTPNEIVFFYENINRFRIVPIDGRPHDPVKLDGYLAWFGDSVGHWEGDTLVIDTRALLDQSWLGPNGYIHTEDTHVVERVHRNGDTLYWDTTVEDPMLLQPWQMDTLTAKLNSNPKASIWENSPCVDKDKDQLGDPNEGR